MTDNEFHAIVDTTARLMAQMLADRGLVKRPKLFVRMLDVYTKATSHSWGGTHKPKGKARRPTITISKAYRNAAGHYWEYKAHREDPEIGEFVSANRMHHILAIVAHEISHAADHWSGDHTAHGSEWRHRYRTLRREWGLTRHIIEGA